MEAAGTGSGPADTGIAAATAGVGAETAGIGAADTGIGATTAGMAATATSAAGSDVTGSGTGAAAARGAAGATVAAGTRSSANGIGAGTSEDVSVWQRLETFNGSETISFFNERGDAAGAAADADLASIFSQMTFSSLPANQINSNAQIQSIPVPINKKKQEKKTKLKERNIHQTEPLEESKETTEEEEEEEEEQKKTNKNTLPGERAKMQNEKCGTKRNQTMKPKKKKKWGKKMIIHRAVGVEKSEAGSMGTMRCVYYLSGNTQGNRLVSGQC